MSGPKWEEELGSRIFARSLVQAARRDAPSADAYRRTLAALTSSAIVGSAALATTTAAASKSSGTALSLAGLFKFGAAGIAAGAIGLGVMHHARDPGPPATVQSRPAGTPSAASAKSEPTPEKPLSVTDLPALPTPDPDSTVERGPERTNSTRPEPRAVDDLATEAEVLRWARAELAAKAPGRALVVLEGYRATWPNGRLGLEATVLRIEALAQQGRTSEANALAERFLAAHSGTPFANRVRALVGKDRDHDAPSR